MAGARLLAVSQGGGEEGFGQTVSDGEGRYEFILAPGEYMVAVKREGYAQFSFRALREKFQIPQRQAFEHKDLSAAEQGSIQFERGVFRGGAHQHDRAVLHVRQKPILLRFVEAVDLVHEEQSALPVPTPDLGRLEDFPQFGHAGENGADLDKTVICFLRQQACNGRLADARRTTEHERKNMFLLDCQPYRLAFADQVFLADELLNSPRAHSICKRLSLLIGGVLKEVRVPPGLMTAHRRRGF